MDVSSRLRAFHELDVPNYPSLLVQLESENRRLLTTHKNNSKDEKYSHLLDIYRQMKLTQYALFKKGKDVLNFKFFL
jgi:hypothetical protein